MMPHNILSGEKVMYYGLHGSRYEAYQYKYSSYFFTKICCVYSFEVPLFCEETRVFYQCR